MSLTKINDNDSENTWSRTFGNQSAIETNYNHKLINKESVASREFEITSFLRRLEDRVKL